MTDLTNAVGFKVESGDAKTVDRWSKKGDRLYINDLDGNWDAGYVDLQTGEVKDAGEYVSGEVAVAGDTLTIEIVAKEYGISYTETHEYEVIVEVDWGQTEACGDVDDDEPADGGSEDDERELVADGGVELPSNLSETMIRERIRKHDDPDHENANTLADVVDAWRAVQEVLRSGLDQHVEYHDVVGETASLVVFDTGTTHEDQEIAYEEAGVDDEILAQILDGLLHDVARDHCDHDWGVTYPLVVIKSREQTRMESYVRQRLGQLVVERGGAARGLDYWATKVQGLTFSQWERESGRSTGAIGNSISRGDAHDPGDQ